MISDCNQNESILELASKLAVYAAENARKRQRETKDEIGKYFSRIYFEPHNFYLNDLNLYLKFLELLKSELESERKLRKIAETKAEKTGKASRE